MPNSSDSLAAHLATVVPPDSRKGLARGMGVAWLVLTVAVAITLWAWHLAESNLDRIAQDRFDARMTEMSTAIVKRMNAYEQVLRGGVSLFAASEYVTRDEWRLYVNKLALETHYPGIQGMGYARWIEPRDKDALIETLRAQEYADFTLWPEGERPAYSAIILLEPFDWRNQRALGYDMFSEPVRRAAMERARDTGQASVSGKITLVQETDHDVQPGFLMYLPVYMGDDTGLTIEQRREALQGYVYSPFRMNDLMQGIFGARAPDLRLRIYDGREPQPTALLYDSALSPGRDDVDLDARLRGQSILDINGRAWTLIMETLPAFTKSLDRRIPILVIVAGLSISLLLFAITWSLATTRERALALAEGMIGTIKESEIRLREIASTLGEGVYVQDSQGRITFCNPEARRLLGWTEEELLGKEAYGLFMRQKAGVRGARLHRKMLSGQPLRDKDVVFRRKDGASLSVAVSSSPIRRDGELAGAVVAFRDISQRLQAEAVVRESQRFRSLFEYARDALFLVDAGGQVVDANPLALESLGYGREQLIGMTFERFFRPLSASFQDLSSIIERLRDQPSVTTEANIWRRDGIQRPVEAVFSPLVHEGRQMLLAALRDITERKQAEGVLKHTLLNLEQARQETENANQRLAQANQELKHLSQLDGLTGIANRRRFNEYLEQEWRRASRAPQPLALILGDVDHFKNYNDHYGHQAGDDCLSQVAQAMAGATSRTADLLARYGGEEFVAVLPGTTLEGATHIAERMRAAVEELKLPHATSTTADHITLSLGVAASTDTKHTDPGALLAAADAALYQAKEQGRNQVCVAR